MYILVLLPAAVDLGKVMRCRTLYQYRTADKYSTYIPRYLSGFRSRGVLDGIVHGRFHDYMTYLMSEGTDLCPPVRS